MKLQDLVEAKLDAEQYMQKLKDLFPENFYDYEADAEKLDLHSLHADPSALNKDTRAVQHRLNFEAHNESGTQYTDVAIVLNGSMLEVTLEHSDANEYRSLKLKATNPSVQAKRIVAAVQRLEQEIEDEE